MDFLNYIIDIVIHIDVHLTYLVAQYGLWVYAILFAVIFCETGLVVTPFLPGDSLLFATGALAAISGNDLNVNLLALLLILAAVLGDATNYAIGRFFGQRLFSNPDSRIFKQSYLERTHKFYEKHGGKTIIIARFVPIIRTFAPFVAGMGRMNYKHFASFNVIGGALWVPVFLYAGYFFGGFSVVKNNLSILMLGIIFVSVIPVIVAALRRKKS